MAMNMYSNDQESDGFYPKEEDGGVDYFEWCASFLTVPPKDGYMSSASSSCSSNPPSERSSPNVSPYSTPEQYPPPSPSDVPMTQYCYEPYQEEPSPRIVVPQVFQTINIGVVQQYPHSHHAHALSHSQGGFSGIAHQARPLLHQIAHNQVDIRNNNNNNNNKELLLIDHSKEVQKRKALVMDVTPIKNNMSYDVAAVQYSIAKPVDGFYKLVLRFLDRPCTHYALLGERFILNIRAENGGNSPIRNPQGIAFDESTNTIFLADSNSIFQLKLARISDQETDSGATEALALSAVSSAEGKSM